VIRAIADPTAPIGSLFNLAGVALVCAAALALEFRQAIQNKLDRWYMRDILDREKRLRSLLAEIAVMDSAQDLEQSVLARLKQIFGVENNPNSDEPITIAERELLDLVASQVQLVRDKFNLADQQSEAVLAERQRIAREIHDTVGHGFAGIALSLDAARKSSAEEADRLMHQASTLARKSLRDTRESIAGLREPASLDLAKRLQSLAEFPSVSVRLEEGAAGRASSEAYWHLARIAEEAVTNARKHASGKAIRVELEVCAGQLVLRISDDGIGFNTSSPASGYGLNGMRERMHVLNGTLKIVSTPGKGTQICAEVPL
jgi:signal transduction histidine kinase